MQKPIVALLRVRPSLPSSPPSSVSSPSPTPSTSTPSTLSVHPTHASTIPSPDPLWILKRHFGRIFGWVLGWTAWVFVKLGGGLGGKVGVVNFFVGLVVWRWWNVNANGGRGSGHVGVEGEGSV